MQRLVIRVTLSVFTVVLGACGSSRAGTPGPVPFGTWGGRGIQMEVSVSGATVSHLDGCSQGVISEPLIMDSSGRFEVDGVYWSLQWITQQPPNSRPALFSGRVRGSTMELEITHTHGSRISYRLSHGVRGTHEGVVC